MRGSDCLFLLSCSVTTALISIERPCLCHHLLLSAIVVVISIQVKANSVSVGSRRRHGTKHTRMLTFCIQYPRRARRERRPPLWRMYQMTVSA